MPEEDNTKHFIISLIIQQLYREILVVADEQGGKLKDRITFYLDEIGTIPMIDSIEMMFSASRSRRLSIVTIIQSLAQLEKNYDKLVQRLLLITVNYRYLAGLHLILKQQKHFPEI